MSGIEKIKNHPVIKQVLKDSFWGVIYDEANRWKYDTEEVLFLWEKLNGSEKESVGWIIKWAIDFLQEKKY